MYQRNLSDESYMALTFGTLLSSQGAGAHRHSSFELIGGNLRYATRSVSQGQCDPHRPASRLVDPSDRIAAVRRVALGGWSDPTHKTPA
jgi:hypothetical protein